MRKLKEDKKIKWTESYTDKSKFLKDMYADIIGPKSYFRFEGKEIGGSDEWNVVVSPSGVKKHEKKWFAGIRKLPDSWPAGGKKFDSITDAFAYAYDTWGVPRPQSLPHYTMTDLKNVSGKEEEWRAAREAIENAGERAVEKSSSSASSVKTAMAKGTLLKSGLSLHVDDLKGIIGQDTVDKIGEVAYGGIDDKGEPREIDSVAEMAIAAEVARAVRSKLLESASRTIASTFDSAALSVDEKELAAVKDGSADEDTMKLVIRQYKARAERIPVGDKFNVPVNADDVSDCITWNSRMISSPDSKSIALNAGGKSMRQVLVDFSSTMPGYSDFMSEDAKESLVLSSVNAKNVLMVIAAVRSIEHIDRSEDAVSLMRRSVNQINKDFADVISMSTYERSLAWLIQADMKERLKFKRRMAMAKQIEIGSPEWDALDASDAPISLMMEFGRTDGSLRAVVLGPYMSDSDFKTLKSIRFTSAWCQAVSGNDQALAASIAEYLSKRNLLEVDLAYEKIKDKMRPFMKKFGLPFSMIAQCMFEDIPLAYSKEGTKMIRVYNGNQKRRLFETIGSWYFGKRAMPEKDPVDNPLLADLILRPKMSVVGTIEKACRHYELDSVADALANDYKGNTRAFISLDHFQEKYLKGEMAEVVFFSSNNMIGKVIPSLEKRDGISPSISLTVPGSMQSMRYILGDKWKMKQSSPEVYKDFLLEVIKATASESIIQSGTIQEMEKDWDLSGAEESKITKDAVLSYIEAMADYCLNSLKTSDVVPNRGTVFNTMKKSVSPKRLNSLLNESYSNSIMRAYFSRGRERIAADTKEFGESSPTSNMIAEMNSGNMTLRLKTGYRPSGEGVEVLPEDAIVLSAAHPPELSGIVCDYPKFKNLYVEDFDGRKKVYHQLGVGDVVCGSKYVNMVNRSFEKGGVHFQLSNYDPSSGSSHTFSGIKSDQKNPDGTDNVDPLLDYNITGDASFGEFVSSVLFGWYGDTPIKASFDDNGRVVLPFMTDKMAESNGTRDLWGHASFGNEDIASGVSTLLADMDDARALLGVVVDRVASEKRFWWRDEQPKLTVVRPGFAPAEFKLVDFMNLDVVGTAEIVKTMVEGTSMKAEFASMLDAMSKNLPVRSNPSYYALQSDIELSRSSAKKYALAKIIMPDIRNGMLPAILDHVKEEIGITTERAMSIIPGTGSDDDIADKAKNSLALDPQIDGQPGGETIGLDVEPQVEVQVDDLKKPEDESRQLETASPVDENPEQADVSGRPGENQESRSVDGPSPEQAEDAMVSPLPETGESEEDLEGEPPLEQIPAAVEPVATPAVQENVVPEQEQEKKKVKDHGGVLTSSEDVRGIMRQAISSLARLAVMLSKEGKTAESLEVTKKVRKFIGPREGKDD
jgi:hypothetical protein